MDKWKGSLWMKAAAWVALTLCAMIFMGSVLAAAWIWEADFYEYTEEKLREDAFQTVAERYSQMALLFYREKREYDWEKTNFRFGIIQAEEKGDLTFPKVDLNSGSTYLQSNFTGKVEEGNLYKVYEEISDDTYIAYSERLAGDWGLHHTDAGDYETEETVEAVCYDTQNGVFYYETENGFYPVPEVAISLAAIGGEENAYFVYDFEQGKYRYLGLEEEVTVTDAPRSVMDAPTATTSAGETSDGVLREVYGLLSGANYLTFHVFEGSEWSWGNGAWREIRLGDTLYAQDEIMEIDDLYLTQKPVAATENYYINEAGRCCVSYETPVTPYWVVSQIPEHVGSDWDGDLFEQANAMVTYGWNLRYRIYGIMLLAVALGIGIFVFLMCSAGHRRGHAELVLTWLDRAPFDICLGAACAVFLLLSVGVVWVVDVTRSWVVECTAVCVGALCAGWLLLLLLLSFAVRVKQGKWWRNTISWHVFASLKRLAVKMYENLPLLAKTLLAMGGLAILELTGIAVTSVDADGRFMWLWGLEKVALTVAAFLVALQMRTLKEGGQKLAEGDLTHRVDTSRMLSEFRAHGESLNSISVGMLRAVDERMKSERFKTELITNVSHDIKTPLTSIINYVDLLDKEEIENRQAQEYIEVLKRQSGRLKKLIEDLIEASKASTGNLSVNLERLDAGVSVVQTTGEFEEKLRENDLELLIRRPEEPIYIRADSRHLWRVIDNLMNNICKYAQPNTRVYINLEHQADHVVLTFRNTSRYPLNITSEELMERFVRGDSSRNTEGSGLGLSIARSLMELMEGTLELYVDGDLFKVVLTLREEK